MKNAGPQLCFGLLPRIHDPQCRGLLISCKKTVGGGDEIEEEKDMEGEQKDFFIDFARRRRTRVQDFWRGRTTRSPANTVGNEMFLVGSCSEVGVWWL